MPAPAFLPVPVNVVTFSTLPALSFDEVAHRSLPIHILLVNRSRQIESSKTVVTAAAMSSNDLESEYAILGLAVDATPADAKRCHKELALRYHPDKNKGQEAAAQVKFVQVQNAYESLMNKFEKYGVGATQLQAPFEQSATARHSGYQPEDSPSFPWSGQPRRSHTHEWDPWAGQWHFHRRSWPPRPPTPRTPPLAPDSGNEADVDTDFFFSDNAPDESSGSNPDDAPDEFAGSNPENTPDEFSGSNTDDSASESERGGRSHKVPHELRIRLYALQRATDRVSDIASAASDAAERLLKWIEVCGPPGPHVTQDFWFSGRVAIHLRLHKVATHLIELLRTLESIESEAGVIRRGIKNNICRGNCHNAKLDAFAVVEARVTRNTIKASYIGDCLDKVASKFAFAMAKDKDVDDKIWTGFADEMAELEDAVNNQRWENHG